jgi:hypothetical protein
LESKNLPITTGFPELINHLTFGNRITNKYKGYKLEADSENNKDGGSGILFIPELKAITKSLSAQKPTVVLRDSGNLVLTGKANVREIRTPSEIVILSPPKTAQGYENSAMKNPPPLNFKSTPESANRESSAKSPSSISQAASTKTGVAVEKKVINSADDLKPEELSRLAEKVYAQLENMLAKEKRRFGL